MPRPRLLSLLSFLAPLALPGLLEPEAAQADATLPLARMKAAAAGLKSLHAIVRCETRVGAELQSTRFAESWIDVKHGLVRTEIREKGQGAPRFLVVADPAGLRIHQLEFDEIAAQRHAFDLPTAVAASFAGELLATAFRGDLASFKAAAYGKPKLAPSGEVVGGVGCTHLTFAGNAEADLWIGDADALPRRIRGPLPGATLEETVVRLEADADLSHVAFEIPVAEGRHLPDPSEVRKRWSSPPPDSERWLAPEDDAPDFAALDLEANQHALSETAEQQVVLAFWTAEDEKSPALAAQAEQAWRAAGSKLLFRHVAAGNDREPVADAVARNSLHEPVWVAGSHPNDAFRRYRIWRCPVFVRVNDMQIAAVTRDLDVVRAWFK